MEGRAYQMRMAQAYRTMANMNELQAHIFEMTSDIGGRDWEAVWEEGEELRAALWELHDLLDNAKERLANAIHVAHYG